MDIEIRCLKMQIYLVSYNKEVTPDGFKSIKMQKTLSEGGLKLSQTTKKISLNIKEIKSLVCCLGQ